ncbi:AfsR/SARP family transcriptional regulator [Streptomyces sp. 3214.6]|uniref:AfsR/SARP family transcriptional regulator n=1 Tax=Streptomyces sp. 3214.6 TaxID=1882757 RepID=UPI00090ADAFF|nr:BTAD domain-containing putative transcriptional regulator [Streptomyces sp. 3214.6]SHH85084.1 DNA-binding transcriptional activator of the SARP family [Streptomyces sp. 3214.6]
MRESVRRGRIELFDGFRLQVDGTWIHPASNGQRLLAFLSLLGPGTRSVVAGTLWANVPENRALGSLRTTMWRLNHTVPGLIVAARGQLTLAEFVTVDVTESVGTAGARLRHPGGTGLHSPELRLRELLPGWDDDWVIFERDRLRQLRLHQLEAAAADLCALGDYAMALDTALEAVRSEPLRESARRAVITVHRAEGNFAEALHEYERFRALLTDQLGVEPSLDLTDLVFRREPLGNRTMAAPI